MQMCLLAFQVLLKIADMVSLMISSGIALTELKFDFRKERFNHYKGIKFI